MTSSPLDPANDALAVRTRRKLGGHSLGSHKNRRSWQPFPNKRTCGDIFADTTIAAAMLDRLLHRSVVVDATAVEAMVDRLVHHAEVIVLQGESYRLKDRTKEVLPKKSR